MVVVTGMVVLVLIRKLGVVISIARMVVGDDAVIFAGEVVDDSFDIFKDRTKWDVLKSSHSFNLQVSSVIVPLGWLAWCGADSVCDYLGEECAAY